MKRFAAILAAASLALGLLSASCTGSSSTAVSSAGLSFSAASVSFGYQTVATPSTAQTVTLKSTGDAALIITSVAVTGAKASDFTVTNTCGNSLAPGAICTASVTFTPSAPGSRTASVSVSDNAAGSPQMLILSGMGVAAGSQFMTLDPTKTFLINTITGKPVFITGEQAYNLNLELSSNSDVDLYLSTRQAQGFNFIWVATTDMGNYKNAPANALGQPPFGAAPFTGMNEAYFEHLDYVLHRAAAYGFEVLLMPAFAGSGPTYCSDATGWCLELQAAADSDLTKFGAYLGNRYKNYPNIIWAMGGDLDLADFPLLAAKEQAILNGLRSADPNHLITCENEPGTTGSNSQDSWPANTWNLDFFYHDLEGMAKDANSAWTRSDHLPTFLGEDVLEGESVSPADRGGRIEKYQAVLGGTNLGFVFGNCVMWAFGYRSSNCTSWQSSSQWKTWFNTKGAIASMYLGRLMRSREFWKMAPDINHTVVTAGYGSGDTITVTSRSSDGQTILAYIPNGNATSISVNMNQITSASSTANCWWFNPTDGATTMIGSFANSGTSIFTPPDANDWVLVIDDAGANLAAPGTTQE